LFSNALTDLLPLSALFVNGSFIFLPQSPVKAAALCVLLGFYLSCVHLWSDWSQTVVPCI